MIAIYTECYVFIDMLSAVLVTIVMLSVILLCGI